MVTSCTLSLPVGGARDEDPAGVSYGSTWEHCRRTSPAAPTPPRTLSPGLSHPHPRTAYLTARAAEAGFLLGAGGREGLLPPLHHTSTLPAPCLSARQTRGSGHALHPCGNCHGSRFSIPANTQRKGPAEPCVPAAREGYISPPSHPAARVGRRCSRRRRL